MKEYIIALKHESTPEQIWEFVCSIKPKTLHIEILSITVPMFVVKMSKKDIRTVESNPIVKSIELNEDFDALGRMVSLTWL